MVGLTHSQVNRTLPGHSVTDDECEADGEDREMVMELQITKQVVTVDLAAMCREFFEEEQ